MNVGHNRMLILGRDCDINPVPFFKGQEMTSQCEKKIANSAF